MSYPRGNLEGFYHREQTPVKIMGRFTVDAVPVTDLAVGRGYTVARTALGRYTVTFTDAYSQLITANATVMVAAGNTDVEAQLGAFTPGGAGTATLLMRCMVANAEVELTVGDYLMFEATLYGETLD